MTTIDADIEAAINGLWILTAAILCFLLQAGFGLYEVGSVREKNAQNIMLKNMMDVCVSAIAYWSVGYAFAWGDGNSYIGTQNFFLKDTQDFIFFFFQWVFAGTTATIVSGAVAERCRFRAYLIYSFWLCAFVYPVACHWAWHEEGWMFGHVFDYAGGGAVHMVGGGAAFAGAWVLGPRLGRYTFDPDTNKYTLNAIPGHNAVLAATGGLLLFLGFFPFNAGSGLNIVGDQAVVTGRIAIVTALAGAGGGMVMLWLGMWYRKCCDLSYCMNGVLSGMVSVCSGCNTFQPWAGLFVGATGSLVFFAMATAMEHPRVRIDDPLGASALHFGAGAWGMLMVGFLGDSDLIGDKALSGILYGGDGTTLGWQVAGILVYTVWALGTSLPLFYGLLVMGWFRVSEDAELEGMDTHHHGGVAYPGDVFDKNTYHSRQVHVAGEVVEGENGINEEEGGVDKGPEQAGKEPIVEASAPAQASGPAVLSPGAM
uniref:Ammonium transporter n=1 Tax=Cyclophora tenuis TaxID=216820 RepID=A0A7S1D705_CYCTE|mmetsp:Transcript_25774/g.43807  ORF Transcript_25774/g.43807 Transcript_25774/m.43807 type:complete len:483 (+) Transcript_25774:178-1626(+)